MKKKSLFLVFCLGMLLVPNLHVKALEVDSISALENCLSGTEEICKLTDNVTSTKAIKISGDRKVVLNLNGKKFNIEHTLTVEGNAELTINGNGEVEALTNDLTLIVKNGGSLILENGSYTNKVNEGEVVRLIGNDDEDTNIKTYLKVGAGATLSGNYGVIIKQTASNNSYGTVVDFYGKYNGLTGNDGYNEGSIGLYINGKIESINGNVPVINIYNGSEINSVAGTTGNTNDDSGPAIYAAGYGIWNIYGGKLSGTEVLSIKSGKFNITGGTFNAFGEYVEPPKVYNDGTEATGAAISITANGNYAKNVELNIENAAVKSEKGYAIYEGKSSSDTTAVNSMTIKDGEFSGAVGAIYADGVTNFIEGGTFNSDIEDEYLSSSVVKTLVNGSYVVGETPKTIKNPDTVDFVTFNIIIASISALILGSIIIYRKKLFN